MEKKCLSFFSVEKQGQHAGAHMGAGEGLVGNQNQLPGGGNGFDALCQNPGILRAVPVGDGHNPVSRVHLLFGVHLGQGLDDEDAFFRPRTLPQETIWPSAVP